MEDLRDSITDTVTISSSGTIGGCITSGRPGIYTDLGTVPSLDISTDTISVPIITRRDFTTLDESPIKDLIEESVTHSLNDYVESAIFTTTFRKFIKDLLHEEPETGSDKAEEYLAKLPGKIIREFCKDFAIDLIKDYKSRGWKKDKDKKIVFGIEGTGSESMKVYSVFHTIARMLDMKVITAEDLSSIISEEELTEEIKYYKIKK